MNNTFPSTVVVPTVITTEYGSYCAVLYQPKKKFRVCQGCGGSGGHVKPVDWHHDPQWVPCDFCSGNG